LTNPALTIAQVAFFKYGTSAYSYLKNTPSTNALMSHSLELNPQNIVATKDNQYSFIADSVQKSQEYNDLVNKAIGDAERNGQLKVDQKMGIDYESGDLKTSIHLADLEINAHRMDNGSWDVNATLSDKYNYQADESYKQPILATANNSALVGQASGVISNYGVTVEIHETRYSIK
jgi:hypothetical protein